MSEETTPKAPGVKPIETIISAAIKRSDGIILAGRNHAFVIQHSPEGTCKNNSQQGFITSLARFVGRTEAASIAFLAKQIKDPSNHFLFSEDITQDNPWAGEQIEQLQSQLANHHKRVSELTSECLEVEDDISKAYTEINGLKSQLAEAEEKNERLLGALGKYGRCEPTCASWGWPTKPCSCGYQQALKGD